MAKAEGIDNSGKDDKPVAADAPHSLLPQVDSPSISPAIDAPLAIEAGETKPAVDGAPKSEAPAASTTTEETGKTVPETIAQAVTEPAAESPAKPASILQFPQQFSLNIPIKLSPRQKRAASRAATVAFAAAFGAIAGALTIYGLTPSAPKQEVASAEERQAMQKSIARLAKDLTALKASVETAGKSASTQIGKLADRLDRADRVPETTGSIAAVVSAPKPAAETPMPQPRPQIVQGWFAYESREGFVLVEQRGGELFRVAPGTQLPGLGAVEAIRREAGQVVVVTPKGLITQSPRTAARSRYRSPFYYDPY